jgi:hypothetical protein
VEDHPGSLVDVLLELCRKLNPVSGYGGIGVIASPDTAVSSRYEPIVAALDSRFIVHRFPGGVMIQAGSRPDLGDAERDLWPDLYVKLAKELKPVQVSSHGPMQISGPGLRMDGAARTKAWLRRFDDR